MSEPTKSTFAALFALTFVTGLVDAASVLGLGHVFTANMTGNVVFLGFALAGFDVVDVLSACVALGTFMLGALIGGRLSRWRPSEVRLVLGIEIGLLACAATLAAVRTGTEANLALIALLGTAMGLRNAVIRRLLVADMTTTVLTLTLAALASDSPPAGGDGSHWPRRVASLGLMLAGAIIGGLLVRWDLAWALAAGVVVEVLTLGAMRR